jgi:hypothetical protein
MAAKLSVIRTGRALLPRNIISLLLRLEGLGKLKKLDTSLGLETTTFRLVA